MKVLVTGGEGFIGSVLCPLLIKHDYDVTVFDKPKDIRNLMDLKEALRNVEVVVHLASMVGICERNPSEALSINFNGTVKLFETAEECNVPRFLFASSTSLYGVTMNATEDSPTATTDLYTFTKKLSEDYLKKKSSEDLKVTIMRFANAYGVSPKMRYSLLNQFIAEAYLTGKLSIYSPESWRSLIHVADLAQAILLLLKVNQSQPCEVFNVGVNEQNYRKGDLGKLVAEYFDAQLELIHGNDVRSYHVNFNKIKNLGFTYRKTPKDACSEVGRHLERGVDANDFEI